MRHYCYIMIFFSFLFASCAKEEKENPIPKEGVVYTLTGVLSDRTKALISDEGAFSWAAGDAVSVLDAISNEICTFSSEAGDGNFTFTGEPGRDYNFTKAWYPASMASQPEVISYPAMWNYEDICQARNFPMAATVSDGVMCFYHLGGLLKLTINEVPIDATALQLSSDDVSLSGEFGITSLGLDDGRVDAVGEDITVEDGIIDVLSASTTSVDEIHSGAGTGAVTITDFNLSERGSIKVYIPLPCGTYGYKISLDVDDTTILEQGTTSGKTIDRASLVKMRALTVNWPSINMSADYNSTQVSFVKSDIWGWWVAGDLPADTDVIIVDADDSDKQYGTRFATKKHAGYFCQCFTGGTSGAFQLKQDSDLYISSDKKKIFPLAAGTSGNDIVVPAEYEVAHYGLRGDFAGTLTSYTSAGIFTKTDDSPADGGNWKWYVVRNVYCTGTPMAFKLYGTAYKAGDGVLETGTTTPQSIGVARSLARPVSGETYAVKYNVTPGMSYDVYLKEDLTQVLVCEAGSYNSSVDESYLTSLTNYGLYNYGETSYICAPGIDQTWVVTDDSSTTFVLAKGYVFDQVEISNLPQKDTSPSLNQSVDVAVSITPSIGSGSSSTVTGTIVKIDGNKIWLLSDDGTGIIADYKR